MGFGKGNAATCFPCSAATRGLQGWVCHLGWLCQRGKSPEAWSLTFYLLGPLPWWLLDFCHQSWSSSRASDLYPAAYWTSLTGSLMDILNMSYALSVLSPFAPVIVIILHTHNNFFLSILYPSASDTPFYPFVQTKNPVLSFPTYKWISKSCHLCLLNVPYLAISCCLCCLLDKALHLLPTLSFLRCYPSST